MHSEAREAAEAPKPQTESKKENAAPESDKATDTVEAASAPSSSGGAKEDFKAFCAAVGAKVNSAVKTYLGLSEPRYENGGLCIVVLAEAMVFMDKPDVRSVFEEAGAAIGLAFVHLEKKKPAEKKNPLADIRARAEGLGIEIKK